MYTFCKPHVLAIGRHPTHDDRRSDPGGAPFQALIQAVAHQQLNCRAANKILSRFTALFPKRRFPSPEQVDDINMDNITGVGFSRAKAS